MSVYIELTAGYAVEIKPGGGDTPARFCFWHDHEEMPTLSRYLTAREYDDLCEQMADPKALREQIADEENEKVQAELTRLEDALEEAALAADKAADDLRQERAEHEQTRRQLAEALDLLEGGA